MNIKWIFPLLLSFIIIFNVKDTQAQSRKNDIPVNELPSVVKKVLDRYISILSTSETLDQCEKSFVSIAGGGLVDEMGTQLRRSVKPYSLKKDFNGIRFYKVPIEITRVNVSESAGNGYGYSAIRGKIYKVWIAKKDNINGYPAPISIMVPEGHKSIKTPKIVGIGSL